MMEDVKKLNESIANVVIGRKFPADVDSPLFLDKVMDNFFNGLEDAEHNPSKHRQREIEHTVTNIVESFGMAVERLIIDIEASVALVKGKIEEIGNNNAEGK